MVKNKKNGGHFKSTHKTKKSVSKTSDSKDLTTDEESCDIDIPSFSPEPQFTSKHQLGFPDKVYLLASIIFQNHYVEKPASHRLVNYGKERDLPLPEIKDKNLEHSVYELAFSALKYQELLEDIMTDSCFYPGQPIPEDQTRIVVVMLYDFQDRKFLPRQCHGDTEIIPEVQHVESYLLKFKIKLAASLARFRIKHDLSAIDNYLPESLKKKQEMSTKLPLYGWINTLKTSIDDVEAVLRHAGFSKVEQIGQLVGETFCHDVHCRDTLVFSSKVKSQLHSTELLKNHRLVIQDKVCCLGPNAAHSLLPEDGDVLMVGYFSCKTVSHTACLVAEKKNSNFNSKSTVFVCVSNYTDVEKEELQATVFSMGCKNVRLILEDFQSLGNGDKRFQKVRVILLMPRCSVSAVSNPIEFILQENGDTCLLQDLSRGSIAQSKLESLVAQQRKDIDHALKFPLVLSIVYSTCSSLSEENVDVVNTALQQAKARVLQEGEAKHPLYRLRPSPFISCDHGEAREAAAPYFVLEASEHSNGCFLAVLNREYETVKEAPGKVIARANAKGILDRIGPSLLTAKDNKHSKTKKASHGHSSQIQLSSSGQTKKRLTKSCMSIGVCEHQESKQPSQAGKPKAQRLQVSKTQMSNSNPKQEPNNILANSKPGKSTPPKDIPSVFTTQACISPPNSACPPATPLVPPAVRPRRTQQEVLKPVLLMLPPVEFPTFLQPTTHNRPDYSANLTFNRWKMPAQTSSRNFAKDARRKPSPDLTF